MSTSTQARPTFTKRRTKMTPKMQAFKLQHNLSYVQLAEILKLPYSKCYAWTTGVNGPQSQKEFTRVSNLMRKLNKEASLPIPTPAPLVEVEPPVVVEVEKQSSSSLVTTVAASIAAALATAAAVFLL